MGLIKIVLLNSWLLLLGNTFSNKTNSTGTIDLEIQNIQQAKGSVLIAIYRGEENFLEDGQEIVTKAVLVEKEGALTVSFDNLAFGEYSIAIYHDVNDNKKLDTNLVGIPNEPYGFSNDARSKWGPPKYRDAQFNLNQNRQEMVIQLKKWIKQ